MKSPYQLCLVTNRDCLQNLSLLDIVQAAISHGVSYVQLREKNCSTREFIELGRALSSLLSLNNVPLFINDRIDVAMAVGAQGVHLGHSDMSYFDATSILPTDMKIGLTINSLKEFYHYQSFPVDYFGVSALYTSRIKQDIQHHWTADELCQLKKASKQPLIGIGGITLDNITEVLKNGLDGIAVSSALCALGSIHQVSIVTQNFIKAINQHG